MPGRVATRPHNGPPTMKPYGGSVFQGFEGDGAHAFFLQLHVDQWELVFEAVADELDDVFFFGFGENIAGSEGGECEGLQVAHLVERNQDNRASEAFIFAEEREVFQAAVLAFFADLGGIDEVAGEFAHVVGGHFHVRAGEIEQQGVWFFFMVGGCHVELRHPFDGPGGCGGGRSGFRFCE